MISCIVFIGYGSIAKKHKKALDTIVDNIRYYALRSSRLSERIEGVISIYDYDEVSDVEPDAIIISNPTSLHRETLLKCIPYGKPILIEKPSLGTLSRAQEIKDLLKAHNVFTYVGCNLRFLDCLQYLKGYIETSQKRINEINVYAGSYLPSWRPNQDYRKSYSSSADMGGGVHLDLIHEMDYVQWIFGDPERISKYFRSNSSLGISAVDYAHYVLSYRQYNLNITLNYFRRESKRQVEVLFMDETWIIDLNKNSIVTESGMVIYSSSNAVLDTYTKQMRFFLDEIENSTSSNFNTFEESLKVLKMALQDD